MNKKIALNSDDANWSLTDYACAHAADREVANAEDKLRLQVQTARLVADAATRIKFENIDKDNFLLIVAPADGVITDVTATQSGGQDSDQCAAGRNRPQERAADPEDGDCQRDRAFLRDGLPVQMKFNAFPYQRDGRIRGTLEQDQYKVGKPLTRYVMG